MGGWVRGCREEGGRGYFGWKGGYGALRDWAGVVKSRGSVGWCVTWHCDISLDRVGRHLCHGMVYVGLESNVDGLP